MKQPRYHNVHDSNDKGFNLLKCRHIYTRKIEKILDELTIALCIFPGEAEMKISLCILT